jgi:hypothetical protein
VFTHGDLQITHVFVEGDAVTGIIDWSEASQGDALFDLATLTLAHEEHLEDVLAGYGTDVDRDLIRAWWSRHRRRRCEAGWRLVPLRTCRGTPRPQNDQGLRTWADSRLSKRSRTHSRRSQLYPVCCRPPDLIRRRYCTDLPTRWTLRTCRCTFSGSLARG